jgi:site-specific DNA-methyltransferase (adenine-specific)
MTCTILQGDCRELLKTLPDESVNCCVTSPPYWGLRDYGVDGQIGLEQTPESYIAEMVAVFSEVKRVLRDDGVLWLNLGDSYASFRDGKATPDTTRGESEGTLVPKGQAKNRMASTFAGSTIKHKDLVGIPWRVAFALQSDGWYLRQDIIWHKPNPMPESVTDRCTKAHEYVFLLTKSARYYYDADAIAEPSAPASAPRRLRADLRLKEGYSESHFGNPPVRSKEKSNESTRVVTDVENNNCGTREHLRGELEGYAGDAGSSGEGMPSGDSDPLTGNDYDTVRPKALGRGGKNAFRGQGSNRDTETGPANREGRDMKEIGIGETRNRRSVWTVCTQPYKEAHFATFPPALITPMILAGCPVGGTVLDPFGGSGTTGEVAESLGRNSILCELNPAYIDLQKRRTAQTGLSL